MSSRLRQPPDTPVDTAFAQATALTGSATDSTADSKPKVSHLTFSELTSVTMQLFGRLEVIWQRVVYIHAAMIGVMVFFSQAETGYTLARGVVYAFYSVNLLIAYFNLREIYAGLENARTDLAKFPPCDRDGAFAPWLMARNYAYKTTLRALVMAVAWALVGGLLFLDLPWN